MSLELSGNEGWAEVLKFDIAQAASWDISHNIKHMNNSSSQKRFRRIFMECNSLITRGFRIKHDTDSDIIAAHMSKLDSSYVYLCSSLKWRRRLRQFRRGNPSTNNKFHFAS